MKPIFRSRQLKARSAFSRVDLLATLAVLILLGGWLGFNYCGERGRIVRCSWNLQGLGKAMQFFANDHDSALPPAGVSALQTTWDMQIATYLTSERPGTNPPSAQKELPSAAAPKFFCPSDPVRRGDSPRSYALSSHDMTPGNWPPGPENTTGVGLWWGWGDQEKLQGRETQNLDDLLLVKLAWLPDPADTLLLTEFPSKENRMRRVECVRVDSVREQGRPLSGDQLQRFHHGRFNYLMADGHVELLTPLQTGGLDGHAGIWTIKKGD